MISWEGATAFPLPVPISPISSGSKASGEPLLCLDERHAESARLKASTHQRSCLIFNIGHPLHGLYLTSAPHPQSVLTTAPSLMSGLDLRADQRGMCGEEE